MSDEPIALRSAKGRKRRRRGDSRGFAFLPQLFTTGNLALGFYAIVKASEGQFERACVALIFAGIFDALDGRVARMTSATSRFGAEYDSIADTVSFGVAPAILAFNAGAFHELGWTGWVLAFMYTACAALRLARFNVSQGRYRGRFEGLPSPPAAGMVVATVLLSVFLRENGTPLALPASLPAIGLAGVGLLMVSAIPYRSFKEARIARSYGNLVFVIVGFLVILSMPAITLFMIGVVYVGSGPAEWLWRRHTGETLEELVVETGEENAP